MIRNDNIRERVGVAVAPIVKKMVETRLRWWFGHVERRHVDSLVWRVEIRWGIAISLEVEEDLEEKL